MLAIKGGKILTITQGTIERGTILIEDGKILDVGVDVQIPEGAEVIDATGKVVMPGLVEAQCHLGIVEESIGWAGADSDETTDPATPQMRVIDGIKANADEGGLRAALETGVTTIQVLPGSGNVIAGTAAVLKTAPKTVVDEMVVRNPSGMKITFGDMPRRVYGQTQKKTPSTRMGIAGILREWLVKAQNYMRKKELAKEDPSKMPDKDLKLEALEPVLRGEIPLLAHAHRADDIASVVRVAEEFGVKVVWHHATEGHRVAEWVARKGIPAVHGPAMRRGTWEMREMSFKTAKVLHDAGVKIAITTDATSQAIRLLPLVAALYVKNGLPRDVALRAMTINPAEILGVADRVGSIERGKDADLRILSGDPLDIKSKVEMVLIDGKILYSA
ncbi:amidohydrolase [Candidatus Bathyarchaeota archaeon]|nr:amidohydrolase [Candidatus Bathyarchaeota archaeon]